MDFSKIAEEIKNSKEDILIVADSDLDGKISLNLMKIILKNLGKKYMEYFRLKGENNADLIRILDGILKNNNNINTVIFLDTPMEDRNLISFSRRYKDKKIIYIDHHKRQVPKYLPDNLIYFDVRALFKLEICTTSIVYRIGKSLFNDFSKYSILASIGAIGDFMLENDEELINDLLKNYNSFYNGKYFTTPFIIYFYLFLIAHPYEISKNIDKALNIEEFVKGFNIKKLKKVSMKYYEYLSKSEKIYESDKILVLKSRSSGVISTFLSAFYPNKLIVVLSLKKEGLIDRIFRRSKRKYSVSLRYQNGNLDLGSIMKEFADKYGITGGGHPKAAGGLIYEKDINNLIKFLEEKINEKN